MGGVNMQQTTINDCKIIDLREIRQIILETF